MAMLIIFFFFFFFFCLTSSDPSVKTCKTALPTVSLAHMYKLERRPCSSPLPPCRDRLSSQGFLTFSERVKVKVEAVARGSKDK